MTHTCVESEDNVGIFTCATCGYVTLSIVQAVRHGYGNDVRAFRESQAAQAASA